MPQIPSSAVEMPGSTEVSGLNVQFGALDFGSEACAGSVDMCQAEPAREAAPPPPPTAHMSAPTQQSQNSLFSKRQVRGVKTRLEEAPPPFFFILKASLNFSFDISEVSIKKCCAWSVISSSVLPQSEGVYKLAGVLF